MITKNHEEEVDAKFNFMDPHDPRKFFNLPTPVADKWWNLPHENGQLVIAACTAIVGCIGIFSGICNGVKPLPSDSFYKMMYKWKLE